MQRKPGIHRRVLSPDKSGPRAHSSSYARGLTTLVVMTKAPMEHAELPRRLWPKAMRNAVYVQNRVYNKETHRIPYGMKFGIRPDADHIRKLRALAYVYVSVPPRRLKRHDTSKAGFMLGFADGVY